MTRLFEVPAVARYPSEPAITIGGFSLSFESLATQVQAIAAGLVGQGFQPGDRLALLLPSSQEFVVAYFGAAAADLVVMPLNPLLGTDELRYILRTMQPRAIIAPPPYGSPLPAIAGLEAIRSEMSPKTLPIYVGVSEDQVRAMAPGGVAFATLIAAGQTPAPSPSRAPDAEALILFTSGTSGRPKGVSLTESALMANAEAAAAALSAVAGDVILCPLPLSHVFGQVVAMIGGLLAGSRLELVPRPTPDAVFAAMIACEPTLMLAVPTTLAALARIGAADPAEGRRAGTRLRVVGSGGGFLPEASSRAFATTFGVEPIQGYGMTETGGVVSIAQSENSTGRDVGRVLPTFEYRIDPIDASEPKRGELQLRGSNLLRGYYIEGGLEPRMPEDWFETGDLVEMDEVGRMFVFDRKKELIIRGGYNVYPSEVEAVLLSHPQVQTAAAIGFPHADLGQEVGAFVTLRSDESVDEQSLIDWCRAGMALYKYPRRILIVAELPLTPTGKVLKRDLPMADLGA